ncbi:MAG: hemolysin family protein [Anaerolineae bacterium]|nr:hemolysin family protein [Anaerolineae bacterium]
MDILISFSIILVLILLNGMFVAAEFAIIGIRPSRVEQLADEGNRTARRLLEVVKNPPKVDRYIATAQLGITLASLGLGMVGEPSVAHLLEVPLHDWLGLSDEVLHTVSFLIGLSIITYLHVVIGEMVPKSLSLQNAERAVLLLAGPMFFIQGVFSLAVTGLNRIGLFTLRVLRVPPPAKGSRLHTPDELELIISDSVAGGMMEESEHRIVSNIFEFAELRVEQVMTPRVKVDAIPVTITETEVLEHMFHSPHSRLPVYEDSLDNIIGLLHLKELAQQQLAKKPFDLHAILHVIPSVPEGTSAEKLLSKLKRERVHMAIVLDEYGGTAGIVTMEDLIEQIMGDVRDEFDVEKQPSIMVLKPGHLLVEGDVRLHELTEYLDIGDPDSYEVDSIGGLLLSQITLPPAKGDQAVVNKMTLRAEEVNGLTIERLSVLYTPQATSTDA